MSTRGAAAVVDDQRFVHVHAPSTVVPGRDAIADAMRAEADAIVFEATTDHGRLAEFGLARFGVPGQSPAPRADPLQHGTAGGRPSRHRARNRAGRRIMPRASCVESPVALEARRHMIAVRVSDLGVTRGRIPPGISG